MRIMLLCIWFAGIYSNIQLTTLCIDTLHVQSQDSSFLWSHICCMNRLKNRLRTLPHVGLALRGHQGGWRCWQNRRMNLEAPWQGKAVAREAIQDRREALVLHCPRECPPTCVCDMLFAFAAPYLYVWSQLWCRNVGTRGCKICSLTGWKKSLSVQKLMILMC